MKQPKLFISYSRVDEPFVSEFIPRLSEKYEVWFDRHLIGGQEWWQEILAQIAGADIFIYLLSNESVISPYCRDEYEEAKRLKKAFLPVLIRARTDIPDEIKRIQIIDFSGGLRNDASWLKLDESIGHLASQVKKNVKPRDSKVTPLPSEHRIQFVDAIHAVSRASEPALFAKSTDELYKGVLGRSSIQIREDLNLQKTDSPRKYFGEYAVFYVGLAEKLAAQKLRDVQPTTNDALVQVIADIAAQIGIQAKATSELLGYDLVTEKPL